MSSRAEILEVLAAGAGGAQGLSRLVARVEEDLARVETVDDLRSLLGATTLLLHAGAARGELILPDLSGMLARVDEVCAPAARVVVVGLGAPGWAVLTRLSPRNGCSLPLRRILIDLDRQRNPELDGDVMGLLLEGGADMDTCWGAGPPRFREVLSATYRSAGGTGLIARAAEAMGGAASAKPTVHLIAGLEDYWLALVPELILDLRAAFGSERGGRFVLHLLFSAGSRLRPSARAAAAEIETTRLFDDGFIICASKDAGADRVAEFLEVSAQAPELLALPANQPRRGAFSSYGMAFLPFRNEPLAQERGGAPVDRLEEFEAAFRAALPCWRPLDAVLGELAGESVHCLHPPAAPPPAEAWRVCPGLQPVPTGASLRSRRGGPEGGRVLCRIQRGLRLSDLRLT